MDEMKFPDITKSMVSIKKVKKTYKQKFDKLATICRLRLFKEHFSQYQQDTLKICNLVGETLNRDRTYDTGNHLFLFSIMECHFGYIQQLVPKLNGKSKDALPDFFDVIHDKNKYMLKLLEENKTNPITQEDLKRFVEEQHENEHIARDVEKSGQ